MGKSEEVTIWNQNENCLGIQNAIGLGPLHTQAKNHGHEIVRAPKKVSKGRPKAPPKSCSVVTDP